MDREQKLRNMIWEHEKMYKKRKLKLVIKTLIVLSVCFYVVAFMWGMMQEPIDYLSGLVVAVVAAGIFMLVAILALTPLMNLRESELTTLTRLKKELESAEKISAQSNDKNRYSLSFEGEKRKETGTYNVYGSDIGLSNENKK